MKYHYEIGAVRWRRHNGESDVRAAKVQSGWRAEATLLEFHPTTDKRLRQSEWWMREIYCGRHWD